MDLPIWIIYGLSVRAQELETQFELSRDDYLRLWMYFEDRADNVKEAMFKTLTWTIGYAAALLGFIFLKLVDFDTPRASVRVKWLVTATAAAGIVICLYSWFALRESGKHIRRNWGRAERCKTKFRQLNYVISGLGKSKRKGKRMGLEIWQQLYIIVALFALAFIAVIIWAITDAKANALILKVGVLL